MMTNYGNGFEDYPPSQMTLRRLWEHSWMAITGIDYSPARWAIYHDCSFDLLGAWGVAGHALEILDEEDAA